MARYTLTSRQKLSPTSMLFAFEPSSDTAIGFEPGQYVSIRFKRFGRPTPARCFSVVNSPNAQGLLELGVRVEGKFTTALNELPTGSEVLVDGPFGQFYFDQNYDKKAVFIAGGIGITPILSIIKEVTRSGETNPLTLLYSVRSQEDVPFAQELLQMEQNNPNLRVVFVVTGGSVERLGSSARVINGRISPELIAQACNSDYENTSFFICGPQGFMDSIEDTLRGQGTPDWRINVESFTQAHAVRERGFGTLARKIFSVYGLTAIGFFVITTAILGMDLSKYVAAAPKASTNSAASTTSPADDTSTQTTTSVDNSNAATTTPVTTAPTQSVGSSTTTQQTTTTPTYYQTYQRPTSTVS